MKRVKDAYLKLKSGSSDESQKNEETKVNKETDDIGKQSPDKIAIAFMGDGGIGCKSNFCVQLTGGQFCAEYDPTIEDTYKLLAEVDCTSYSCELCDLAGQEEYRALRPEIYRKCEAYLVGYSVISRISFEKVVPFIQEIINARGGQIEQIPMVLVGNKVDVDERQVATYEGEELARRFQIPFFETSAKTGLNLTLSFHTLIREWKRKIKNRNAGIHNKC